MPERTLPETLPVFPLTGVLLLPAMWLPLNVFEPRYRNMVRDALAGARYIGMIQPVVPRDDNSPPPDVEPEHPELYPVGCAGAIERWEQTADGRYAITLKGVSRFRIREELPLLEGYRRVIADYGPYRGDAEEEDHSVDAQPLLAALEEFGRARKLEFDFARLSSVAGIALLNGLAMSLPFGPAERQALLEAPGIGEREKLLLTLMRMSGEPATVADSAPPVIN